MKCTPRYNVIYRGDIHRAGVAFEIDAADATELRNHGVVEDNATPVEAGAPEAQDEITAQEDRPARKQGRPRKEQ